MKKVARAVTVESLEEPQVLDEVLNTDGWRNLMAITAESARAFLYIFRPFIRCLVLTLPCSRTTICTVSIRGQL